MLNPPSATPHSVFKLAFIYADILELIFLVARIHSVKKFSGVLPATWLNKYILFLPFPIYEIAFVTSPIFRAWNAVPVGDSIDIVALVQRSGA